MRVALAAGAVPHRRNQASATARNVAWLALIAGLALIAWLALIMIASSKFSSSPPPRREVLL